MKKYVIIVGGGKGTRMGNDLPKQFLPVAGKPLLMHTLEKFNRWDPEAERVLVLPEAYRSYWEMLCREIGCKVKHRLVSGGETRFHSVLNGLRMVRSLPGFSESDALVAVHDGVRPFVSPSVIEACFGEAEKTGAAIPALPMVESLREKLDDGSSRPVDRSRFVSVQTPQVFRASLLRDAYDQPYTPFFTDDASVVEAAGHPVSLVEGNRENIKLTTPVDLEMARAILGEELGKDS